MPGLSFRAQIAGRSPVDITGANVWDYIGVYNGGGIQTIYDADNSVIDALTGGNGYGVLRHRPPEWLSDENPTEIIEGWQVIGGRSERDDDRADLRRRHARVRPRDQSGAHADERLLRDEQPERVELLRGRQREAGARPVPPLTSDYPAANQIETMYPMIDPFPDSPTYNSPDGCNVLDDADDMAALASIYPAPGRRYADRHRSTAESSRRTAPARLTGVNVDRAASTSRSMGAMSHPPATRPRACLAPTARSR